MAYWYDDTMHRTAKRYSIDLSRALHTYTIRWRDVGMDWLIDGELVHQVRGTPNVNDVPWEPMSMRVIVRLEALLQPTVQNWPRVKPIILTS